jgi:hypothetical protein
MMAQSDGRRRCGGGGGGGYATAATRQYAVGGLKFGFKPIQYLRTNLHLLKGCAATTTTAAAAAGAACEFGACAVTVL